MTFINNFPVNFNIQRLSFGKATSVPYSRVQVSSFADGFVSNPIIKELNSQAQILAEIRSNPKLIEILENYKIPLKLNMQELNQLNQGHLKDTRIIAAKIYSNLPQNLKENINLPALQDAAMLHDYGKVLIPSSILNKAGALTNKEQKIMQLHAELGYELLKNTNLSDETLKLIKNHHNISEDLSTQILSTADKYSALREKRCYKEALDKDKALSIIKQDVENKIISPDVYNALIKSI